MAKSIILLFILTLFFFPSDISSDINPDDYELPNYTIPEYEFFIGTCEEVKKSIDLALDAFIKSKQNFINCMNNYASPYICTEFKDVMLLWTKIIRERTYTELKFCPST